MSRLVPLKFLSPGDVVLGAQIYPPSRPLEHLPVTVGSISRRRDPRRDQNKLRVWFQPGNQQREWSQDTLMEVPD